MDRPTFALTRRVEFHETDAAGLMHFSNYYRWMEVCEHEWFRTLGLALMSRDSDGVRFGWPRREAACEFRRPLKCGDLVRVTATVLEVSETGVSFAFVFEKDRDGKWTENALGRMATVHVRQEGDGRMRAEPIPPEVRAAFGG